MAVTQEVFNLEKFYQKMKEQYYDHWAYAGGSHYNFKDLFTLQESVCRRIPALEYPGINPLTIRLCLLQESFRALFDLRIAIRQETSNPGRKYDETHIVSVSGARSSTIVPSLGCVGGTMPLKIHEVYKSFYAFSSFFCSTLDRLAYEIYIIYAIGEENTVDWRKFWRRDGKDGPLLQQLDTKNQKLAQVITEEDFSRMSGFRDAFEHGKNLEIGGSSLYANFDFVVKDSSEEVHIVEFCQDHLTRLLRVCEKAYATLIPYQ